MRVGDKKRDATYAGHIPLFILSQASRLFVGFNILLMDIVQNHTYQHDTAHHISKGDGDDIFGEEGAPI